MANISYSVITIGASGGTFTIDTSIPALIPDVVYLRTSGSPVTLTNDVVIQLSDGIPANKEMSIIWDQAFTLDVYSFTIPGSGLDQDDLDHPKGVKYIGTSYGYIRDFIFDPFNTSIKGGLISDNTIGLAKLTEGSSAQLVICDSTGAPQYTDVTGDVTIDNAGVTSISSGVIVDADINASAAITRSKLASGTASHVIINNGSGVISSEAQLANSRGGTGLNSSSSTGFPKVSSGTWSVDSIAVDRDLNVSFEAGETGDFKIKMGFDGTLTDIYAFATKVIAGTDNGTIVPKNNAGTTMTSGTITFTASDARGTAYTSSPSANNTFVAGDVLTFTTAKTTSGGKVHLSLKFTRNS